MAGKSSRPKSAMREDVEVHLGANGLVVGRLYLGSGKRSAFRYDEAWLRDARFFNLSPDLQPVSGVQHPQGVYFHALMDTGPDAWGERVIRRSHAKLRQKDRSLSPLAPVDFLLWVDDEARVGALRLFDIQNGVYLNSGEAQWHVPPLVVLPWAGPGPSLPCVIQMAPWPWVNFQAKRISAM